MATSTTNLGLIKPAGTDKIRIAQINQNMDILDEKIGAVGNTSLQAQITTLSNRLATKFNETRITSVADLVTYCATNKIGITRVDNTVGLALSGRNRQGICVAFDISGEYDGYTFIDSNGEMHSGWITTATAAVTITQQLTSTSINCEQYCSSSETDVATRLFCYGKMRTLSFMGTVRTHVEDEVIMTLPSEHRPVGQVMFFGTGTIKGTPVVMRCNGSTGQIVLFLINGATSSARLYFTMTWVVA